MNYSLKSTNYTYGLFAISLLILVSCDVSENHQHENTNNTEAHPTEAHQTGAFSSTVETLHSDHKYTETQNGSDPNNLETRQAESHAHGEALLAIALDGNSLIAEIESPLHNFVGFERLPQTNAERQQLKMAEAYLSQPVEFLNFNMSAKCKPDKTVDDVKFVAQEAVDEHDHQNNEHHAVAEHQDIILEYSFSCNAPENLTSVTVKMFDYFPNLTELEVIFLGPGMQTQSILKPGSQSLNLSK